MNTKKIKTIVRKEWAEVFKNRMVLFTVAFLPLIMTALPLAIIYGTNSTGAANSLNTEVPSEMVGAMCAQGLTSAECFQVFMVSEFMLMFMEANATPEILAANFGYQAVKAFDLQIKALRDQL